MEHDRPLAPTIKGQFENAWGMLREIVNTFSDEEWRQGDVNYLVPARIAYHTVETVEYYSSGRGLKAFPWGHRAGVDWESAPKERLPSRQVVLDYLEDVRRANARWIDALGDVGLTAPDETFHDEGMTHLDRALYVLRHTHQHLGELCAEMRRRGLSRPGWR